MTDSFFFFRRPVVRAGIVLFSVLGCVPVFSRESGEQLRRLDEILPSLSETDKNVLLSDGQLLFFHEDGVYPNLLPNTAFTSAVVRDMVQGNLTTGIEGLFFHPVDELPADYLTMNAADRDLALYNIMRSISTLQGLEYYSASRGHMRLLFEESWTLASEEDSTPVEDPLVDRIPADSSIVLHQKDMSFGSYTSRMRIRAVDGAFAANLKNLNVMRYKSIFRVAGPQDMQIHLAVVPTAEGLLVYGAMAARTARISLFASKVKDSFSNRVVALAGWYRTRLDETFSNSSR